MSQSANPAWAGAIATPAREFSTIPLPIVAGHLPSGIQGSLYRNGPARLERNGYKVGHWLDGDGALLGIHFNDGEAAANYRYVRSAGLQDEEAAGAYLYAGYGSLAPGKLWQRWQAQLKNVANTAVMALPDRLLALWEGGFPHRVDPITLETLGLDNLGELQPNEPYSAHPKRHPRTGDIFNFGLVAGANATLNLYRSRPDGKISRKAAIPLNGIPLIHDFVLAERYLVFCVPPLRLNAFPAVIGLASFSDCLMWQPKRGTQIVILDADSFEVVAWNQVEPWFQWHFGRGCLDLDEIVLEAVVYPDFAVNQHLKEVASGRITTAASGQLWRLRLDPQTAKILDRQVLMEQSCEFPVVAQHGDPLLAATYLSCQPAGRNRAGELFGAIARVDGPESITIADAGENRYPSEPTWVQDAFNPDQQWILTVVYDGNIHASEVWVYAADHLDRPPVCRLSLPEVIPHSLHGTWQPALTRSD